MSEIKDGSYTAKVVAYGAKKTQAGDGAIVIQFAFESDGEQRTLSWQGSLKNTGTGKKTALQITLESLEACGFDFSSPQVSKNFDAIAQGASSGVLDTDKEVSIKIEHELGNDGNMYPRVKWVNKIGGGAFNNMMSPVEAAVSFAGIKGDVLAFAAKKPKSMIKSDLDHIPF